MEWLTSLWEERPASHSALQGEEKVSKERADWQSHSLSYLERCARDGSSGKMCRGVYPPKVTEDSMTSTFFSQRLQNGGIAAHGEYLTLNTLEHTAFRSPYPNADGVCSLSDILVTGNIPQRYYLSKKACEGILRRAESRGKALPSMLKQALEMQSLMNFGGDGVNATDYKEPQVVVYVGNGAESGAVSPTIQACLGKQINNQNPIICYENHANDSRVKEMGDCCQSLTSRAGTGGGNLPIVQECYVKTTRPKFSGDCETYEDTGVAPTVNCFDQGDKRANELVVQTLKIRSGCEGGGKGALIQKELSATLGCQNDQTLFAPECYALDSISSNSMKSSNPNSGFHKEEIAKTLDTTVPDPTKNQGGNVIVEKALAIQENLIGRSDKAGPQGIGVKEELAYTQNAAGVMGVSHHMTVRRLLPIECERLMGFPDDWTKIPYRGKPAEQCPDSPRYKACGNSMCVNVMEWIGERIDKIEKGEL